MYYSTRFQRSVASSFHGPLDFTEWLKRERDGKTEGEVSLILARTMLVGGHTVKSTVSAAYMIEPGSQMRNPPKDEDAASWGGNDYHMYIKVYLNVPSLQKLPCLVTRKLVSVVFQQETV